ncbi:melanopsin-like [Lineus longissimus]|uniref:melanopsin-like n=1 Tax=Lineus longissimus TaxID=88925 RepID=UPI002B4DDD94
MMTEMEQLVYRYTDHWNDSNSKISNNFETGNDSVLLNTSVLYFFGGYVVVAALIGTVGNLMVILAFFKFKRLHNNCNILLVNLAIADELMGLAGMPMSTIAFYMKTWPFGDIGCQIYGFLCFLFGAASMTTVCLLSIERYYRLTKVTQFKAKHCVMQVAFIWSYAFFWSVCPLLGWSRYEFEPYQLSCTLDWYNTTPETFSFVFCACTFVFFIPVAVMTTFYVKLVAVIREKRRGLARWANNDDGKREQQLTVMTAMLVVCFIVIWSPYAILSFMAAFGAFTYSSLELSIVAPVLAKSGICINPIIYGCTHHHFRRAFREMLCGKTAPRQDSSLQMTNL